MTNEKWVLFDNAPFQTFLHRPDQWLRPPQRAALDRFHGPRPLRQVICGATRNLSGPAMRLQWMMWIGPTSGVSSSKVHRIELNRKLLSEADPQASP